jgi:hypothetical protein
MSADLHLRIEAIAWYKAREGWSTAGPQKNLRSPFLMMKYSKIPHAWGIGLAALTFWASCATPTITVLDPNTAPEGTVVEVTGTDIFLSHLQFDGANIPTPWYGGEFFTVPYGSSIGAHNVTASNAYGTSAASVLTVASPVTIAPPAIKGVQVGYANFSAGTFDAGQLWVYGANIDVGATIKVDGVAQTTYTSQVLLNDFCGGVDPETFGSPIYHYMAIFCGLNGLTAGATVSVTVVNLDGTTTAAYSYTLPASAATLDSDGDGLLDTWETAGYDADSDGSIDVDLPGMGCDPYHQDLLVEVDIMTGLAYTPAATMWELVENTFANAPTMNVDGEQGIAIHIDRGQGGAFLDGGATLAFYNDVDFTAATTATNLNFYDAKTANFDAKRLNIFRYCIWGYSRYNSSSSGKAEDIWSNDFLVGMDWYPASYADDIDQAETFVHELGHTLNFGHGGPSTDSRTGEPNHLSVMGYVWQFLSTTADWETCTDCYTLRSPGYSEGMGANLVEDNLNENIGVCNNVAIDWDGDGLIETGVTYNINSSDGTSTSETLDDYDEWHSIQFSFTAAGSGWGSN